MVSPKKYTEEGEGSPHGEGCRGRNREGAEGGKGVPAACPLCRGGGAQVSRPRAPRGGCMLPIAQASREGPAPAKAKVGVGSQGVTSPQPNASHSLPWITVGQEEAAVGPLERSQLVHTGQAQVGTGSCGEPAPSSALSPRSCPHGPPVSSESSLLSLLPHPPHHQPRGCRLCF